MSPRAILDAGIALPLLVVVIRECGAGTSCRLTYRDIAKQCGVAYPTLKMWARKIEDGGFITSRTLLGSGGVVLELNTDKIPRLGLLDALTGCLSETDQLLRGIRTTIGGALNDGLCGISRYRRTLGVEHGLPEIENNARAAGPVANR